MCFWEMHEELSTKWCETHSWSCLFPICCFCYICFYISRAFWRSFIASICCNSSNLRSISIGAIFSSLSRTSVGVDFITLRISFMAPLWASSRSFIYLNECIDCPHIIVPYSNFDWIKDLYNCTARSGLMPGKWINRLYTCLLFLCFLYEEWKKVLHLFFIFIFSKAVTINGNWYLHISVQVELCSFYHRTSYN